MCSQRRGDDPRRVAVAAPLDQPHQSVVSDLRCQCTSFRFAQAQSFVRPLHLLVRSCAPPTFLHPAQNRLVNAHREG